MSGQIQLASSGVTGAGQNLGGIGDAAKFVQIDPATGLPVVIGPGGVGGGVEDLLFIDNTGTQFIYRDNGATPPVFTAYRIPAGTAYTVGANPRPYAVRDVTLANEISGERPVINAMATVNAANGYMKVPASSAALSLVGVGAGALGDTLNRLIITVTAEATSTVSITDGTGTGAALSAWSIFPANMEKGTYSLDLGDMVSIDGAWKLTTGAGAAVIALGIFS